MFKILAVLMAAGALIYRLQNRSANSRARQSARQRLQQLGGSDVHQLAAELDMQVRRKAFGNFSSARLQDALAATKGKALGEKFRLLDFRSLNESSFVVLAEGKSQEVIPGRYENTLVDRFYSCMLYLEATDGAEVIFRSVFPEDKEHQYLLEDLADLVYAAGQDAA